MDSSWRVAGKKQDTASKVQQQELEIFSVCSHRVCLPVSGSSPRQSRLTPIFAPAGLAYSNLVYDWVKAAVMFGVINTIARLDHLDPPQPPKCITMLYVFAET